jgi:biopolymer transport protein ExbD
MAISINGGGGLGGRRRGSTGTLSEINVTPFVDVVLVLLIIFMLTAHVMEFGIEVDVPKVRAVKDSAQELPVISIQKDGTLFLNDQPLNINEMKASIEAKFGKPKGVYVRADKDTVWYPIAQVLAELGQAQIPVNMVTKPEDSAEKGKK